MNLKVPLENQRTSHIGTIVERLFPLIYRSHVKQGPHTWLVPFAELPFCNKVPFIAFLKSGTDLLDEYMAFPSSHWCYGYFNHGSRPGSVAAGCGDLDSKTGGGTAVSVIYVCD